MGVVAIFVLKYSLTVRALELLLPFVNNTGPFGPPAAATATKDERVRTPKFSVIKPEQGPCCETKPPISRPL